MPLSDRHRFGIRLPDEVKEQLSKSLTPDTSSGPVFRGTELGYVIVCRPPARGRLGVHMVDRLAECCRLRKMDTTAPGALRRLKGDVPGYAILEPVEQYDRRAADQHKLKWSENRQEAVVDLLPILQPINQTVARNYVSEIPVSLEQLNNQWFLVLHLDDAVTRAVGSQEKESEETDPTGESAAADDSEA